MADHDKGDSRSKRNTGGRKTEADGASGPIDSVETAVPGDA